MTKSFLKNHFDLKSHFKKVLIIFIAVSMLASLSGLTFAADWKDENTPPEASRKIVVFQEGIDEGSKNLVLNRSGAEKIKELPLINAAAVMITPADERKLMQSPDVLRINTDTIFQTQQTSFAYVLQETEGAFSDTVPWGISRIGSEDAWSVSTGADIKTAVIDTGIQKDHPDLEVKGGYLAINSPPYHRTTSWDDDNGHGTHVAGTIAALLNDIGVVGAAYDAHLYAVKVLDRNGSGYTSDIIDGLTWCIDNEIQVINMSFGSSIYNPDLEEAVDKAYAAGIVLVAAAGNSGPDEDTVRYPAKFGSVIAVAATNDSDGIASWSSRGEEVELAAPGVNILSTYTGSSYRELSGTSMASPHAAGTAALAIAEGLAKGINYSVADVRKILNDSAENLGHAATLQGSGLVNAAAAVGAESFGVSISPAVQEDKAWPEETASYTFTIENTGDSTDTFTVSTVSEWVSDLDSGSKELSLDPGDQADVTVNHTVPDTASPGDSNTGTILVASENTEETARFITTARGYAVEITPELQEKSGFTGDTVMYNYTVANAGTEEATFFLEIGETKWTSLLSQDYVTLQAGESTSVEVSHVIDESAQEGDYDSGVLSASLESTEVNISETARFITTVKGEEESSYVKIVKFKLNNTSNPAWSRVSVEWEVSGYNLASVKTEMRFEEEEKVLDSKITYLESDEVSGTHDLRNRGGRGETYEITLIVTDNNNEIIYTGSKTIEL